VSGLDAGQPRKLSHLAQSALDIVRLAQRRGRPDMTLAEILHALRAQARPGAVIEKSSLSRELTHLALDGLLLRRQVKRKSAWEALPPGMDQHASPSSFAYYAPGARATTPVAAMPAASPDFY
jgi:hypothetical protein